VGEQNQSGHGDGSAPKAASDSGPKNRLSDPKRYQDHWPVDPDIFRVKDTQICEQEHHTNNQQCEAQEGVPGSWILHALPLTHCSPLPPLLIPSLPVFIPHRYILS
jgi:hypothetical protein